MSMPAPCSTMTRVWRTSSTPACGCATPCRSNVSFRLLWHSRDRSLRQAEDLLGLVQTAHRLKAEGDQRSRADPGEGAGKQHRTPEPLGQVLDPRSKVDRRPDHGEVEPAGRADIAVDDLTEMQADAGSQLAAPGCAPRPVDRVEALEPLPRGVESVHARGGEIVVVLGRENRQHAVADEFEDLAFAFFDRRCERVEIIVEQFNYFF